MYSIQYKLIGFSNPCNVKPTFIYPVFASLDSDFDEESKYYLEDGRSDKIEEFIEVDADRVYNFMPINAGVQTEEFEIVKIGSPTIYGYIFSDGKMVWGIEKEVKEHILKEVYEKSKTEVYEKRRTVDKKPRMLKDYMRIYTEYKVKYGGSKINDIIKGTMVYENSNINFGVLNDDSSIGGFDPANMEVLYTRVPR